MISIIKEIILGIKKQIENASGIFRLFIRSFQKVQTQKILIVSIEQFNHGRYAFQLINYFHLGGYHIAFYKSESFLRNLHGYDKLIFNLSGVSLFRKALFSDTLQTDFLCFTPLKNEKIPVKYNKKFELNLDYFQANNNSSIANFRMPFFIHPLMNKYIPAKYAKKKNRILFYGSNDVSYDSYSIKEHFKLLSRSEVYRIIEKSRIDFVSPSSYEAFEENINNPEIKDAVFFLDSTKVWIPAQRWMNVLASFDFFIATPGISMPHSHNVIEAMSTGAVPIIQYYDWFFPPLENHNNCIVFNCEEDLLQKICLITAMQQKEIQDLRDNVSIYFEQHITPSSFMKKIESTPQIQISLLFNAEEFSLNLTSKCEHKI